MTKVLGKIPVLYRFCEKMKLSEIIDELCPGSAQTDNTLSTGKIITIMAINRLLEPTPLYKMEEWAEKSGLTTLTGCDSSYFNDDRLARTLDRVHNQWNTIMNRIVMNSIETFSIDPDLIHYDITSLYFEGRYEDSDFITYGYSRDQKPDKKQINLGINMLDNEPFPIMWQIFSGNTMDNETVIENLTKLKSILKTKKFTFVGDRAMISEDIIKHSQTQNIAIIAPLKDMKSTKNLLRTIKKDDLTEIIKDKKNEIEIYRLGEYRIQYTDNIASPDIRVIVVWSKSKSENAKKAREKLISNRNEKLVNLKEKLNKPYYSKKNSVEKKIASIMKKNSVNDLFTVNLSGSDGSLSLQWEVDEIAKIDLELSDGFYVIGTTLSEVELETKEVFRAYKRQYIAERSFSDLKSTIGIRPIYLQIKERIEGLVHITVLSLCIYTLIELLLKRNNHNITTKRMFEMFIGYILLQLVLPDSRIEFQLGPLQKHEQLFIKALSVEDTSEWILHEVNKLYSFRNPL